MLTKEQALDKVRKLLALSKSSNENESAIAAARAARIMEDYRIDAAMLLTAEDEREQFSMNADNLAARASRTQVKWYWALAWAIANTSRCKPWYVFREGLYRVSFVGRPSDSTACRYMLDAISNDVDQLAATFVRKHRYEANHRALSNSFRLGCVRTIQNRLEATSREAATARRQELSGNTQALAQLCTALARLDQDDTALKVWLEDNAGKYRTPRPVSVSSIDAYQAGRTAGHSVRLSGGSAAIGSGSRALRRA